MKILVQLIANFNNKKLALFKLIKIFKFYCYIKKNILFHQS